MTIYIHPAIAGNIEQVIKVEAATGLVARVDGTMTKPEHVVWKPMPSPLFHEIADMCRTMYGLDDLK